MWAGLWAASILWATIYETLINLIRRRSLPPSPSSLLAWQDVFGGAHLRAQQRKEVLGPLLVLSFQITVTELGMKIHRLSVIFLSFLYLFLILR